MYCKSCVKNIDNDSIFCTFCGIELHAQNNKTKPSSNISEKNLFYEDIEYDSTYKKDLDAQFQGVAILILTFLILLILITHKV